VRRGIYRALALLASMAVVFLVIFPLAFSPGIELPSGEFPDNPFSLRVRITNQNLTPYKDVDYTCESTNLELATGRVLNDARIVHHGSIKNFSGRRAITVRCETAYIVTDPLKAAEFKLVVKYRPYPWPVNRVSEYRIAAVIDSSGRITKWVQK